MFRGRGDQIITSPQNAAEFWNVCTRPATARGGLGLTVTEADRRLRIVERLFPVLPDQPSTYSLWRRLVVNHRIQGFSPRKPRGFSRSGGSALPGFSPLPS
jgi:hypothetical protein